MLLPGRFGRYHSLVSLVNSLNSRYSRLLTQVARCPSRTVSALAGSVPGHKMRAAKTLCGTLTKFVVDASCFGAGEAAAYIHQLGPGSVASSLYGQQCRSSFASLGYQHSGSSFAPQLAEAGHYAKTRLGALGRISPCETGWYWFNDLTMPLLA